MKQLVLQDIRERLSAWLAAPAAFRQVVAVPFGRLGSTPDLPVISNIEEVRNGSVAVPGAGDIITRRQQLDIGVYDVWWYFSVVSPSIPEEFTVGVENADLTISRYAAGFTAADVLDGGAASGRAAFLTQEQDDQIVFRIVTASGATINFHSVIIQRLP